MKHLRRRCALLLSPALLTACTGIDSLVPEDPKHELTGVPFFPQTIHQCGPAALATVLAYLIGSLSFAVIVSRALGLDDPRNYGSGNPGATNVLRSGKRSAAVLTLALDALKGYAPVLAALWLAPRLGWGAGTVAAVGRSGDQP